jgi:hypothetical protein
MRKLDSTLVRLIFEAKYSCSDRHMSDGRAELRVSIDTS